MGSAPHDPAPVAPRAAPSKAFVDSELLHARLADAARRCYPPPARRFGLTGEARVDFCLNQSGGLASTTLSASTGHPMLDAAARECVVAGALPFPAEAAGGCYSVPVRFGQ
jgi:TonB family protein